MIKCIAEKGTGKYYGVRPHGRPNAPRAWGMQPNTSLDESLVLYHLSSDSAYYTIFRNSAVTGKGSGLEGSGLGWQV